MPTGKSWFDFIFVNIVFIVGMMIIVFLAFISNIRNNWPIYRCNPMYMPFSQNVEADFTYCVQDMQKNMMGNYLQPFNYILSNVGTLTNSFTDQLNDARKMFTGIRGFNAGGTFSIFSAFNNITIEFQKMVMGLKDIFGKLTAILVTFMYTIQTFFHLGTSFKDGPLGQLLMTSKGTASSCFHPTTQVQLHSGTFVKMSDLKLGDVLIHGGVVRATMKIENPGNETMYCFKGDPGIPIYVTGSHYIFSDKQKTFVRVEKHEDAEKVAGEQPPWFSCMITSDHKISLGKYIFWDWQDHLII